MRRVGILFNARITEACRFAEVLDTVISREGVDVWRCAASDEEQARELLSGTDMAVSLGGDGTMLRVARISAPARVPILGINFGNVGFTTELTASEAMEKIHHVLNGEAWIDERAMLQVDGFFSDGTQIPPALNDVVVARGSVVRVIEVTASVNDQPVTTYKGDGVIVATATGSTGYSLAAGGPILFPRAKEFLLTPMQPHLCLSAALVLSADAVVELEVETMHEARCSVDGQVEFPLSNGDKLAVKISPYTTQLLRLQSQSFFYHTLLERLGGRGKAFSES